MGLLLSVNVGSPEWLANSSRVVRSAIGKTPVAGQVAVRGVNVEGDDQADRRVHGGPDQAVYAYAAESYAWWSEHLGRNLVPGTFGENVTVEGIEVEAAVLGTRWRIGTALLEVTAPRIPCFKLASRMGDPAFPKRFALARRPGAYLRIVEEGLVGAGDAVDVVEVPGHGVTIATANEALLFDQGLAACLLDAPQAAAFLLDWARERAAPA
jgi:MOSC domain-containing protein YiiM